MEKKWPKRAKVMKLAPQKGSENSQNTHIPPPMPKLFSGLPPPCLATTWGRWVREVFGKGSFLDDHGSPRGEHWFGWVTGGQGTSSNLHPTFAKGKLRPTARPSLPSHPSFPHRPVAQPQPADPLRRPPRRRPAARPPRGPRGPPHVPRVPRPAAGRPPGGAGEHRRGRGCSRAPRARRLHAARAGDAPVRRSTATVWAPLILLQNDDCLSFFIIKRRRRSSSEVGFLSIKSQWHPPPFPTLVVEFGCLGNFVSLCLSSGLWSGRG